MQSKLQELTDKILKEGVEKGNSQAEQIVKDAQSEAAKIIEKAKKNADSIITDARKNAEEIKKNIESEIKLSSKQAINSLKQKITDLVNEKLTDLHVKGTLDDTSFIKKILETTMNNWSKSGNSADITIILPESEKKSLDDFFKKSLKNLLDKGIEIQYDPSVKTGFQIMPGNGNYKISFTEQDFINFFKQYLRPRLLEILFTDK